jgi:YHS domain-containing protein
MVRPFPVPSAFAAVALAVALAAALAGCGTPSATVRTARGADVMLLGHDPVAYFTEGRPVRGQPGLAATIDGRTYRFATPASRDAFERDPARYEPQYGGFCANGAAYAIKLGSDPTAWEIRDGRLFVFGDVIGQEMWRLDPAWNVRMADALWPEARDVGWRAQSLRRYAVKVPHYRTGADLMAEWRARHPGRSLDYDPGGMVTNLFLKPPGWRAAEGFGQPALGYPE